MIDLSTSSSYPANKPDRVLAIPVNTTHRPDDGSMVAQRRGRWSNIEPALGRCIVLSRILHNITLSRDSAHTMWYRISFWRDWVNQ